MTSCIYARKKQIANFFLDISLIAVSDSSVQLSLFVSDTSHSILCTAEIHTCAHCAFADLLRSHKSGKRLCNACERIGIAFLSLCFHFDSVPVFKHLVGGIGCDVTENVGVTDDELLADFVAHIIEGKRTCFLLDPAMENYLKQNVAQLFTKKRLVVKVDSLDDLAGLFYEVALDRLVGLLPVPGAAALASQKPDYIEQIADRVMILLLIFNHRKTLP